MESLAAGEGRARVRLSADETSVTGLSILAGALALIPRRTQLVLGDVLGDLASPFFSFRRGIARANLERAVGALGSPEPEAAVRRLLRDHFRHLGRTLVETLQIPALARDPAGVPWLRFEGLEHLQDARDRGHSVLVLTAHQGPFEVLGLVAARGFPFWGLYRHRDYLTIRLLQGLRLSTGMRLAARGAGLIGGLRALKRGGILAVVADQGLGGEGSLFGCPMPLPRGPERLARLADRVMTADVRREADGTLRLRVEPMDPASPPGLPDLNRRFCRRLEQWIREAPEQYYWVHDVWRRFRQPELDRFALERCGEGRLYIRDGYQGRIPSTGPAFWQAAEAKAVARLEGGRGTALVLALGSGEEAVLKHFRRGGILGPVLGDYYWGRHPRPLQEIADSERLRAAGIRTPEILAAHVRYLFPWLYQADLVTRRVPEAKDLADFLVETRGSRRGRALQAVGRLVRRLERAGAHHPDLNLRNFLIEQSPVGDEAWLIDLDRLSWPESVDDGTRVAHLARILRSYRKIERFRREKGHSTLVRPRDALWFLRGYFEGASTVARALRAPGTLGAYLRESLAAGAPR